VSNKKAAPDERHPGWRSDRVRAFAVLVANDQVNGQSVLDDILAFGVRDFVGDNDFQLIVRFVFHAVGTGDDIVSGNADRSEVKKIETFNWSGDRIAGRPRRVN